MALGDLVGLDGAVQHGPIGAWASRLPSRVRAVLQVAAATLAETIVTGTPVDTGYARASWVVSIGGPIYATPAGPVPKHGTPPGTYQASDPGIGIAQWDAVEPLFITNSVAYVPALEYGHTIAKDPSTPPGWVGAAVHNWPTYVGDATQRVRAVTNTAATAQSATAFAAMLAAGRSGGNI